MLIYVPGLIVLAIVISFYIKKDIVYIIPMCVLSSIAVLYVFGLANQLMLGVYALYVLGALGLLFFVYTAIRNKKEFWSSIQLTQVIIFLVFTVILLWAHWGRVASVWDELSHWGRVVKDMVYNNRFATHSESMVLFQNYPPANAVLQYAFVKMRGSFVEVEMYHAMYIIFFSMMMPLFKGIEKKDILRIVSTILIALVLPLGFYTIAELYVDALLAVYFAYILIIYFTNKQSKFIFINIGLAMFAATLTKPSGAVIALLAAFVIYIDFLFANKQKRNQYFKSGNIIASIGCFILPFVLLFAARISWNTHLDMTGANIQFDTAKVTFDMIVDVLVRFNGTAVQDEVLVNFLDAFAINMSGADYIIDIPPMTYIVIFVFIGAGIFYKEKSKENKKRIIIAGISLLVAGAVYFVGLLITYLFMFSDFEAMALASFSRYSGVYLLGVIIFLVAIILHKTKDEAKEKSKIPKYLVVLFILLIATGLKPLLDVTVLAPFSTKYTQLSRARYDDIATIGEVVEDDEKVYLIDIGSTGGSYWACSYSTYPVLLDGPISIGERPYYDGDEWTDVITTQDWADKLYADYDYVYVYNLDYNFHEVFGYLFGGADNVREKTLYYVDKSSGSVELIEVIR